MNARPLATSPSARLLCLVLSWMLLTPPALFTPPQARATTAPERVAASRTVMPQATPPPPADRRAGELLVRFRPEASEQEKAAMIRSTGAERRTLSGGSGVERLRFDPDANVEATGVALSGNPAVEFVEPNYLIKADEVTPDDPRFAEQWALRNTGDAGGQPGSDIGAAHAWDATTGSGKTVIAVIDSGIDFSHPDLKSNQWTNEAERGNNNKDDDHNGLIDDRHGWDWVTGSNEIKDESGHGTAVAGIIAARGNNRVGVSGVMWRAGLMSLRVLDGTGTGDVAQAVEAIDYAVAHGAGVINLSWGTDHDSKALRDALSRAARSGVLVVCSVGNDGRNIDGVAHYPASYDMANLIAVASTDNSDQLTSWSNWGSGHAGIAAPGTNILTTERGGGGYRAVTGSSYSAPHVTGVAGLIRTLRPNLSAERTREMLIQGVRQTATLQGKVATGGVVSAAGTTGAVQSLPPDEGRDEDSKDKEAGNNNGQRSNGNNAALGANGENGNGLRREPVRGRPSSSLPDLNVTRRHQPRRPRAIAPIASTRRNCPPHNPRCNNSHNNGNGDSATPPRASNSSSIPATPVAQVNSPAGYNNQYQSIFIAALNGERPYSGNFANLPLLDYWKDGWGYAVSDTTTGTAAGGWQSSSSRSGNSHAASASLAGPFVGNDAAYVAAESFVPTPMIAGQTYRVRLTFQNTGTTEWKTEESYRLGSQGPEGNNIWRVSRVQLPATVVPGAKVTFNFEVTAPAVTVDTASFQWQMVQDGVQWFGAKRNEPNDPSLNVTVKSPQYQGWLDTANCDYLSGWAWDSTRANTPIEVDIFADGNFLTRTVADQFRSDLVTAGIGNGYHGYAVQTPAGLCNSQPHSITARVANTLFISGGSPYLAGSALTITCAPRPAATPNNIVNAVPGVIQAEDFDQGANGVAYSDSTPGNYGAVYRTTDVDIAGCLDGSCGYWLSWVHNGEWTKYTINVATSGTYTIEAVVKTTLGDGSTPDGSFRIEIDGVDKTGALDVKDEGGNPGWHTKPATGVQLTAGQHVMKVIGTSGITGWAGNLDRIKFIRAGDPTGPAQAPYSGVAAVVPGTIQAEDFDLGGSGVAYEDITPGSYGGVYRTTDVDVEGCAGESCGYWLSWVHNGEWTEYTINVAADGDYSVVADVASMSANADGKFRIEIDGVDQTGVKGLEVPNTTGWYTTHAALMHLTAGPHVMRIVGFAGATTGWAGKLDRIRFTRVGDTTGNSFSEARLEPGNRTGGGGVDLLSGNFNWGLPLVSLPGRSGLDLGLSLSYNSLVWTKEGSAVQFNPDNGYPAPGFRLGFPTIQQRYKNTQINRYAYLMITPSGSRVELRQVGTSNVYESADSSYLQLVDYGGSLLLRTTDGTKLTFRHLGSEYQCTEVKDRNGNFTTITYDGQGGLSTVKDTLARVITFNYDSNHNLLSITQDWNGQPHIWATFGYSTKAFTNAFSGLTVLGPQNNEAVSVLSQVGLADGSSYRFDYTPGLQVSAIRRYSADNHQLAYTAYTLTASADDCPRVTARKDWALDWNNGAEAVTTYGYAQDHSWGQMIAPDGTTYNEFLGTSGWQKGLTIATEIRAGGVRQKWTEADWTQDDTSLGYPLNPRQTDTHIHDKEGNHKRIGITYTAYGLPSDIREYDGLTALRRTHVDYRLDASYVDRRIIGLTGAKYLYGRSPATGNEELLSKVTYAYDETSEGRLGATADVNGTPVEATQHDANYGTNFTVGRANMTSVRRWSVQTPYTADNPEFIESRIGYNTTGAPVFSVDPQNHKSVVSYADSFADGVNRNTFAYPTATTDPDQVTQPTPQRSFITYNYDMGVATRTQGLSPDTVRFPTGPGQAFVYDAAGRIERVTDTTSGAYTRWVYAPGQTWVQTFTTVRDAQTESYSIQVLDGAGRVYASAGDFPGDTAAPYRGQHTVYDVMGRAVRSSNPARMTGAWEPVDEDISDNLSAGWYYATQDYDWKGRPTFSTNADGGFSQELSYGGCGCAGGEVVTIRDAMGRRQRVYHDVLGRVRKTEVLNGNDVYSATTNVYNALDQVTRARLYQGAAPDTERAEVDPDTTPGSIKYQTTLMEYDGYGRQRRSHAPDERAANGAVAWIEYTYNSDDTVQSVVDARGVRTQLAYNNRRQVTGINYNTTGVTSVPTDNGGSTAVVASPNVTYTYDAAGNRTAMTTAGGAGGSVAYTYDRLSRLESEARQFPGLSGTYTLSYQYTVAGALKKVTNETESTSFTYEYDGAGQTTGVTGAEMGSVTQLASGMKYRAWGALKGMSYGNGVAVDVRYDSRGLVTRYALGGVKTTGVTPQQAIPEGGEFYYYADGRLKFASDFFSQQWIGNNLLNRAYEYDQAGRLKEAYTGGEADYLMWSAGGVEGAYRQNYTHDAWGNQTSRTGRMWTQPDEMTATYDARNRNPQWTYDASGHLLSMNEPQEFSLQPYGAPRHTYDAAGRHASMTQTFTRYDTYSLATTVSTTTQTYDGDGEQVRSLQHRTVNGTQAGTSPQTTYYLRSSLLGGKTITEYNAQGTQLHSYSYLGGEVLSLKTQDSQGTASQYWQHTNPVTGDAVTTDTGGGRSAVTRLEPAGVNVGERDPLADAGGGGGGVGGGDASLLGEGIGLRPIETGWGGGGSGAQGLRCHLDGIETGCGSVSRLMDIGAAVQCSSGDCGPRSVFYQGQRTWAFFNAYGDGYQGYVPVTARYTGQGMFMPINPRNGPPQLQRSGQRMANTNFQQLNGVTDRNSEAYLARHPDFSLSGGWRGGYKPQTISLSSDQLKDIIYSHKDLIAVINNCVDKIFAGAEILGLKPPPVQTLANSPTVRADLDGIGIRDHINKTYNLKVTDPYGGAYTTEGPNGTMYLSSQLFNGSPSWVLQQAINGYIHELGNKLSLDSSGRYGTFHDPKDLLLRVITGDKKYDHDTGMNLQRCVGILPPSY